MNEKDKDFDPNFLEFLKRENLFEKYENTHLTNRRFVDFLRKRTDISDKLKQNKIHDFLKYGEQDMPDVKLFLNGKVKQGTKLGIDRDYTFDERQEDIEENTLERFADYIEKYRGKIPRKEYAITEREFTEGKLKDAKEMRYFQYVLCLKHNIKIIDEYLNQLEQQDIDKNDRNFDPNFLEFLKNRKDVSEKTKQIKIKQYLKRGTIQVVDWELYCAENNLPIKRGDKIGIDRDYTLDERKERVREYTLEHFTDYAEDYRDTFSQKQFAVTERDTKTKRMDKVRVLGFGNVTLYLQHQINIIDEYLKQLEQTDTPTTNIKNQKPTPKTFADIFVNDDWSKYIDVLCEVEPILLKKSDNGKYVFVGNPKKHKGVICSWIKDLQDKNIIHFESRQNLSLVLNAEIKNFNLGKDGKTFDNISSDYRKNYQNTLLKKFGLLP